MPARVFWLLFGLSTAFSVCAAQDMQYPLDVAVGPEGTIYVADRNLPGIWQIQNGELSQFFTGSKTFRTPLNAVRCVAVGDDGTLYAGDSSTREVYKFDENQQPAPLTEGRIGIPVDLLIDGEQIIVSDLELQRIWTFPIAGGEPEEAGVIAGVRGLVLDGDDRLLCLTTLEDPLRRLDTDGTLTTLLSGRPFQLPHHVCRIGSDLYLADNYAVTIWKVSLEDDYAVSEFVKGEPLVRPVGICADGDSLLVADPHAKAIFRISLSGEIQPVLISQQ